jgi:rubrerythrin
VVVGDEVLGELRAAFAADSMAAARYAYFGQVAQVEGLTEAASLFDELAETVLCAAHGHLDLLRQLDESTEGVAVGDTQQNLVAAVDAEVGSTTAYGRLANAAAAGALADVESWAITASARARAHLARLEAVLGSQVE